MSDKYVYPGSKEQFEYEFGGTPRKLLSLGNIFIIFVVIVFIIIAVSLVLIARTRTTTVTQDDDKLYNLDILLNLNTPTTLCCVKPGSSAPDESYIYDSLTNITYSRDIPANINNTCNSFPDPGACITQNTDSTGKVKPLATFKAKPYFTFENGLFIGCSGTIACL